MLGVLRDLRKHLGAVRALAKPLRSEVVSLVDDEHVPSEGVAALQPGRCGQERGEDVRLPKEVHRRDRARRDRPRVRVHPVLALDVHGRCAVEHGEVEGELGTQLVTPLKLKRGWANHHRASDPSAAEELAQHQAGFDGLPEPDVIREQQRHPRHLERLQDGVELVGLGGDGALPGGDERRAVAGQSGQACDGRPPQRIAEGAEALRRIRGEPVADARESAALEDSGVDLGLPEDRVLAWELPAVEILNLDEVRGGLVPGLGADVADGSGAASDEDRLPGLGDCSGLRCH